MPKQLLVKNIFLRFLLPVLLAAVLLFAGVFCAELLLNGQGGPAAKEMILQTGQEIRNANELLFEKKTYRIIYDYGVALLDSAIAFDFLPQVRPASLVGLLQNLPKNIEIQNIWFTFNSINFQVYSTTPEALLFLQNYLTNCEQYSSILFSPDAETETGFSGSFCCYF